MALPPRPKSDFYIVVGFMAFVFIATVAGIANLVFKNKSQGAGPQPTSA